MHHSAVARIDPDTLVKFEHRNDAFLRRYLGCPDQGEIIATRCHPSAPTVDVKLWLGMRDAARELFGFPK